MSLFSDLYNTQIAINSLKHELDLRGISLGRVCYVNERKEIKVIDARANQNYVSYWIKPVKKIKQINIGDLVLYAYPQSDISKGIYFEILKGDLGSSSDIQDQIEDAIAEYDSSIKQWVSNQNYVTQSWVTSQNYATQSWVSNQNYATQSWVSNQNYATQSWVSNQNYATQSWVSNQNYVTTSVFNTAQADRDRNILNISRYVRQLNTYIQGGDYAVPKQWVNRVVSFEVNDTGYPSTNPITDYLPQPIAGNPTAVEYKNASFVDTKYRIICNSTTNDSFYAINDSLYIRNASRFKMYVKGDGSITVNGSSTVEYLINPLTQWRLTRTGSNTYTLTDMGYNHLPY